MLEWETFDLIHLFALLHWRMTEIDGDKACTSFATCLGLNSTTLHLIKVSHMALDHASKIRRYGQQIHNFVSHRLTLNVTSLMEYGPLYTTLAALRAPPCYREELPCLHQTFFHQLLTLVQLAYHILAWCRVKSPLSSGAESCMLGFPHSSAHPSPRLVALCSASYLLGWGSPPLLKCNYHIPSL